jgi:hypothetical protein
VPSGRGEEAQRHERAAPALSRRSLVTHADRMLAEAIHRSTDPPKSSIEPFSEASRCRPSGLDAVALMMNATAKGPTAPDAVQIIYLGCLVAD